MLAKAITMAESSLETDSLNTEELIKLLLPHTGKSIRIGITGVPGVGKSTFIEVFGELLTSQGKKVAVLAIDPSSQKTKGSILGDKTRMERLSHNTNVFIRPSPSGMALGGVSYRTRETTLICEAAGYDVILIETVGVGQSETVVRSMVDFFLLLMLAGAGDELQGIKKGIIEMADGIVITKADSENIKAALQAKVDASSALHLQAKPTSGWSPKVLTISSLENKGIIEVWRLIEEHYRFTVSTGYFLDNRQLQKKQWLEESIERHVRAFMGGKKQFERKAQLLLQVMNDALLPSEAARKFWDNLLEKK